MSERLKYWQEKIQTKRKATPWREFVMEIASRQQFNFYNSDGHICRYPSTDRVNKLTAAETLFDDNESVAHDHNNQIGFFENYQQLRSQIKLPYLWHFGPGIENSDFADTLFNSKNCYLSVSVGFNTENMLYSLECHGNLQNVIASVGAHSNSTNIYQSAGIADSYNIFYSYDIQNSSDLWFCTDMTGCRSCIRCHGLINQSYCIDNQQYSKEDYERLSAQFLAQKDAFSAHYAALDRSQAATLGCEGVTHGQFASYVHDANNICLVGGDKEASRSSLYDVRSSGGNITDAYGCMGVSPGDNFYCVVNSGFVQNIYYSYFMANCSYCLGCIGLKNKSYCIFNKQYEKEERYEKVDEIFSQMESDGTLGKFFPGSLNPFYFNDTAAYLIDDSFTKEEVTAKGYLWRDEPIKVDIPAGAAVVNTNELGQYEGIDADGKWTIDPDILKVIIQDDTGNVYRIIPMEYKFLKKHGLPLPRKHWLDRMKDNFRTS